jgi:hypothetical protein
LRLGKQKSQRIGRKGVVRALELLQAHDVGLTRFGRQRLTLLMLKVARRRFGASSAIREPRPSGPNRVLDDVTTPATTA